jgi:hypothetical protein
MGWQHLTPQQITAIKNSPKGKAPAFIRLGTYKDANVSGSMGGHIGPIGGTLGIDRKTNKTFGSINYKGKILGQFGPQGY